MTKRPASSAALSALERRVERAPDDFSATFDLANLLLRRQEPERALGFAKNCVRLAPDQARSHGIVARAFAACLRHAEAAHHLERSIDLGDASADNAALLAKCFNEDGRYQAAADVAAAAERSFGPSPRLTAATIQAARGLGDTARAGDLARAVIASQTADPETMHQAVAALDAAEGADAALAALERLGRAVEDQPPLLLLRGKAKERLARHDAAFDDYAAAKRLIRDRDGQPYRRDEAATLLDTVTAFFTGDRFALLPRARRRDDHAQPVFVCGFPRSGTTLMEAILATSPAVAAGGELPLMPRLRRRMAALLGSPLTYPHALSELWFADKTHLVETLRDEYLNQATARGVTGQDVAWFTDKLPLNEVNLGLIALLFPGSPCIIMKRDIRDVTVSCFSTYLTHGFDCASSIETTIEHYHRVERTAASLTAALGSPQTIVEVNYEDFLQAPETVVDPLFAALGLTTPEGWRDFHQSDSRPNTPSAAQVSQPLNRSGVGRWRRFEHRLNSVDWSA